MSFFQKTPICVLLLSLSLLFFPHKLFSHSHNCHGAKKKKLEELKTSLEELTEKVDEHNKLCQYNDLKKIEEAIEDLKLIISAKEEQPLDIEEINEVLTYVKKDLPILLNSIIYKLEHLTMSQPSSSNFDLDKLGEYLKERDKEIDSRKSQESITDLEEKIEELEKSFGQKGDEERVELKSEISRLKNRLDNEKRFQKYLERKAREKYNICVSHTNLKKYSSYPLACTPIITKDKEIYFIFKDHSIEGVEDRGIGDRFLRNKIPLVKGAHPEHNYPLSPTIVSTFFREEETCLISSAHSILSLENNAVNTLHRDPNQGFSKIVRDSENNLYFTSKEGSLYCYSSKGQKLWDAYIGKKDLFPPFLDEEAQKIYYASKGGDFGCHNINNGNGIWNTSLPVSSISSMPYIDTNKRFFFLSENDFYTLEYCNKDASCTHQATPHLCPINLNATSIRKEIQCPSCEKGEECPHNDKKQLTHFVLSPRCDFYYITVNGDTLYAIDPFISCKWHFSRGEKLTPLAIDEKNERMYIGSGSRLHCLDTEGNELWSYTADGTILGAPFIGSEGEICFYTSSFFYCAYTSDEEEEPTSEVNSEFSKQYEQVILYAKGLQQQLSEMTHKGSSHNPSSSIELRGNDQAPIENIYFPLEDQLINLKNYSSKKLACPPITDKKGILYCAFEDGLLVELDFDKKKTFLAKKRIPVPTSNLVMDDGDGIYFAADKGVIYKYHLSNKKIESYYTTDFDSISYLSYYDNALYFLCDSYLYTLNLKTKQEFPRYLMKPVSPYFQIDRRSFIYLASDLGVLLLENNQELTSFSDELVGQPIDKFFVGENGLYYAFIHGDTLLCLNKKGALLWTYTHPYSSKMSYPTIDAKGYVYFGSSSWVCCLDPKGTLIANHKIMEPMSTSPFIDAKGNVYFVSNNDFLYRLSAPSAHFLDPVVSFFYPYLKGWWESEDD